VCFNLTSAANGRSSKVFAAKILEDSPMQSLRSARWLLLALIVFIAAASQQALGQMPAGTARTGTFIWDGAHWVPASEYRVNFPAPDAVDVAEPGAVYTEEAPPPLPVYEQPPPPAPNLIWTPGYWHLGRSGFYWIPGAWVPAPFAGGLWTPGYWGWSGGRYYFHEGYWGTHVGYYGGVNYGFGFGGVGFAGGEWRGGVFAYNTAVIHVDRHDDRFRGAVFEDRERVDRGVVVNPNHVAFAGGPNGIRHDPTPEEAAAVKETHTPPTTFQKQHIETAKADKTSYAKANGGHPAHLAAEKPLAEEKHAPPPEVKNVQKVEPKVEPKPVAPSKVEPKPVAPPKVEPKVEPKPVAPPKAEPKPAAPPKAEPKPAAPPKAEPKPVAPPKAEPKVEPKPAAPPKVAPKAEPKPAAKTANKPAPKDEHKQ
jgi:hypothetical protein